MVFWMWHSGRHYIHCVFMFARRLGSPEAIFRKWWSTFGGAVHDVQRHKKCKRIQDRNTRLKNPARHETVKLKCPCKLRPITSEYETTRPSTEFCSRCAACMGFAFTVSFSLFLIRSTSRDLDEGILRFIAHVTWPTQRLGIPPKRMH